MQRNSILFLTNAYPDFKDSYRGIFIKKMASLLQKDGYQISIVTPKIYKGSHYFEEQNGIKIYRFPFFAGNKLLIEYKKAPYLKMILYYITGFFLTVYVVLRNSCDMIHAHWAIPTGLIGVWIGGLLGKPVVVTIHGSDLRMALESSGFVRKIFVYVCKNAGHLNCVSNVQKAEMEALGIGDEKISVIPMGVDEAFFKEGEERTINPDRRQSIVLSNRNLLPMYDVSLLIRAAPLILNEEPGTRFLIAGDGSEKEDLVMQVNNLNLGDFVKFLGRVPHQEMPRLLAETDVYVSTSPCDGTSVSLLEALASGAFPVVTDIPSNQEWIVHGVNGFLVPQGNEDMLAKRIVEGIRDRRLLREALERNRMIVKQRAYWRENVKKIVELYHSSP
jgi:glycosyltransferase involved in cell wall biosynthesis